MIVVLGWIFLILLILSCFTWEPKPDPTEEGRKEEQFKAAKERDERMYELERERLQLERERFEWECLQHERENPQPPRSTNNTPYIPRRRLL